MVNELNGDSAAAQDERDLRGNHCFVVMPFGRTAKEVRWFRGWYEVVIEPTIRECGYDPFLSAAQEQPEAINDEIRSHLAFDPMVIVDLGGLTPEDAPNPNVMYELGIRHAFGLPLVIMAWEGQRLPFDISNQRTLMVQRELLDIAPTKAKLTSFIKAAEAGQYYNPMTAVGRHARIEKAAQNLGEDSIIGNLVEEIKELRGKIPTRPTFRAKVVGNRATDYLNKKAKARLRSLLTDRGMPEQLWGKVLQTEMPFKLGAEARNWGLDHWESFLWLQAQDLTADTDAPLVALPSRQNKSTLTAEEKTGLVEQVAGMLPEQPWPKGVHKIIASKLGIPNSKVSLAMTELIRQRRFLPQIDGVVYEPKESNTQDANKG